MSHFIERKRNIIFFFAGWMPNIFSPRNSVDHVIAASVLLLKPEFNSHNKQCRKNKQIVFSLRNVVFIDIFIIRHPTLFAPYNFSVCFYPGMTSYQQMWNWLLSSRWIIFTIPHFFFLALGVFKHDSAKFSQYYIKRTRKITSQ